MSRSLCETWVLPTGLSLSAFSEFLRARSVGGRGSGDQRWSPPRTDPHERSLAHAALMRMNGGQHCAANERPGDIRGQHSYSRQGGYQAFEGEYNPADHQYPKATPYGVARDADHEKQLYADHETTAEITSPQESDALGQDVSIS